MKVTIRRSRADELDRIKQITVEAFDGVSIDRNIEDAFGIINGHDWRWRKARQIDTDANRDPDGIFVAEYEDRIVGYISTWLDREAGIGVIPNLAVDSAVRGHGIGRRLIQHALDYFREQNLSHAKIETLDQNEIGRQLYPAMGFQEVARQIHYLKNLDD